jgi:hypothetical protein
MDHDHNLGQPVTVHRNVNVLLNHRLLSLKWYAAGPVASCLRLAFLLSGNCWRSLAVVRV